MKYEFNPFTGTFDLVSGAQGTPTVVKEATTYTVPEHTQVLFRRGIVLQEGAILRVDGDLIEV